MPKSKDPRHLTITIQGRIPPELNPNWQPKGGTGFWKKNQDAKLYQYAVFLAAIDARNRWEKIHKTKWLHLESATLTIAVHYSRKMKEYDDANLKQALKSAIDALCSTKLGIGQNFRAEIIRDDNPKCLTIEKPIWIKGEPMITFEILEKKER